MIRYERLGPFHHSSNSLEASRRSFESNRRSKSSRARRRGPCLFEFHRRGESVRRDHGFKKRSPSAVSDPNGLRLDQPNRDASFRVVIAQLIEVIGNSAELVAVMFRDNNEASCVRSYGVGEPAS